MRLVAGFDKLRATLTASQATEAAARAGREAGWEVDEVPLADGGEGTLEALGGANRTSTVTGPLGGPVEARWRLSGETAVIEMAEASGLILAGGRDVNDPVAATTRGTGELIREAILGGATHVVVGVGGSATTDGGLGALDALGPLPDHVTIEVACDVTTTFLDAAQVYGPQKGADPATVAVLSERLAAAAQELRERYGLDITKIPGGGAAGGLAGGLAAAGARLRPGFALVAAEVGLPERLDGADLVVTGEGRLDATSWQGKVVGGTVSMASGLGVPRLVVAGSAEPGSTIGHDADVIVLAERYGLEAALSRPAELIREVVLEELRTRT